ncbi:DUF1648 domain-containing protein [Streptomyces sp. SID13726]|uniref:DUF1648 domain-containing protein n=1 Tax=Streptomyces sp. SID13726 TaxID=2706058 RepID=UPI0013B84179|nr:DUF1648 domain-containing protein [Streptomyces sp. SID13726]NEA98515.1 DUF1648 domain-containing protein [Streptomyces sp. SID13726]
MDHVDRTHRVRQPGQPRWYVGLPCLVAALVVGVVFAVSWANLPDPMAVHFDGRGDANRSASPVVLLLVCELTLLGLGVALFRSGLRGSLPPRTLWVASAAVSVFLGYFFTVTVLVNADASRNPRMPLWQLAVAAGAAGAAAVGVRLLVPRTGLAGADRPDSGSVGLRPGETAVWVGGVGPRGLAATGVLGAVTALVAGVVGWGPGLWLWPLGLLVAGLVGARVWVRDDGLTIRPPLLGVPRIHIPLRRIERAWAADVRPVSDLGGYGYRFVKGRRGLALRSGPAVWLELDDGKEFVVAVEDAATAAALLGDLLARDTSRDR